MKVAVIPNHLLAKSTIPDSSLSFVVIKLIKACSEHPSSKQPVFISRAQAQTQKGEEIKEKQWPCS